MVMGSLFRTQRIFRGAGKHRNKKEKSGGSTSKRKKVRASEEGKCGITNRESVPNQQRSRTGLKNGGNRNVEGVNSSHGRRRTRARICKSSKICESCHREGHTKGLTSGVKENKQREAATWSWKEGLASRISGTG